MVLITCPECGKEISNTTDICPNCGYKMGKAVIESKSVAGVSADSTESSGKIKMNQKYLTVAIIFFVIFVVCWYYKASHGVAISRAEVDYAAVRYVSTTMIMGRIADIAEPISIIFGIVFGVLAFVKGEGKNG